MKIFQLSFLCCLIAGGLTAKSPERILNDSIQLINSGEVISEGIALHDGGKYKEAIDKFLSIPESDTNYVLMQAELLNSYVQNKDYDKAVPLGKSLLATPSPYKAIVYSALGTAYDDNKEYESAMKIYKEGLQHYPYDYLLHYNLGVSFLRQEKYDLGIEQFKKVIKLNPYHANSHLYLANSMVAQGKKSRAMMCYGTYLMLVPGNNAALVLLNDLLKNALAFENTFPSEEKNASFKQWDLLIKSNAALDKQFKSSISLEAPAVQQMELLLETVKNENNSDDFWMQFYVPLYTDIYQKELKEAFLYYLLTSTEDKGVKKWLNSNKKELDQFFAFGNSYLKNFRAEGQANLGGQDSLHSFWYYDNNKLNAIGNQIDDKTYYGPWVFYYANGELKAKGSFLKNGDKTGEWLYYYEDGALHKKELYKNGKLDGMLLIYYQNGNIKNEIPYSMDKVVGDVNIYYPCGQLEERLPYKDGIRHGKGETFYNTGELNTTYYYEEGEIKGLVTYFYKNGSKKEIYTYEADEPHGPYQFFYKGGQVEQEGFYEQGKKSGDWVGYYEDGTLQFKGSKKSGHNVGTWINYDEDGSLLSEENYDDAGLLHGVSKFFTKEGQIHYEYEYSDDLLIAYKYYNQQQEVIQEGSHKKGNFLLKAYYPDGVLMSEGPIKNGKMNGDFTFYYHNGLKSKAAKLKDNNYHGSYTTYYESGQLYSTSNYKDGKEDGFYKRYYEHGQVKFEGWMVNNVQQQTWIDYLPDGTVSNKQYYLNGEVHGDFETYDNNGRIAFRDRFDKGIVSFKTQYDTLGAVLATNSFENGAGKYVLYYGDKTTKLEKELKCGQNASDIKSYYRNGKLLANTPVVYGDYNGIAKSYYKDGTLKSEGNYSDDDQDGLWKWYFETGVIDAEIDIKEGEMEGIRTDYHENGKPSAVAKYKKGERMETSYFEPGGQLQIERLYDDYGLKSYRYLVGEDQFSEYKPVNTASDKLIAYYPNGEVSFEQQYKLGFLHGDYKTYYPSGQIMTKRTLNMGDDVGARETYYANGQVKKRSPYEYGMLHGTVIEYFETGEVKRKTSYLFGEKEGWEESYNSAGKLLSKIYFRNDDEY